MKAIVLAGGQGTRLLPVTKGLTPKGLAQVAGSPILDRILNNLISSGIREVCLALGHQAEHIIAHYADGYRDLLMSFSVEPSPLGTGGAVVNAVNALDDDEFLILNGDTYVEIPLKSLQHEFNQGRKATLLLSSVQDVSRFGAVKFDSKNVTSFSEKGGTGPGHIYSGVCITSRAGINEFSNQPAPFSFEEVILASWVNLGLCGYVVSDSKFVDIGTPASFEQSQTLLG